MLVLEFELYNFRGGIWQDYVGDTYRILLHKERGKQRGKSFNQMKPGLESVIQTWSRTVGFVLTNEVVRRFHWLSI